MIFFGTTSVANGLLEGLNTLRYIFMLKTTCREVRFPRSDGQVEKDVMMDEKSIDR